MKKIFYILSVAALALVACNKVEPVVEDNNISAEPFTIQAYADEIGTKATIDGSLNIKWATDDRIMVGMYETGEYTPWEREFKLKDGAGSSNGTFELIGTGTPGENTLFNAIYPKNDYSTFCTPGTTTIDPSTARIKLLESYSWSENTILTPMVAYGTDSDKKGLHFKHIGGAVKVTINGLPKGTTKVSLTSDKDLTGDFAFNVASIADATPGKLTTPTANAGKTVSFTFDALDASTNRVFYFPTPTLTAPSFTIKVYAGEALIYQRSTKAAQPDITRGGLLVMPEMTVSPYYLKVMDEELAAESSLKWGTDRKVWIDAEYSSIGTESIGGKTYNIFILPLNCIDSETNVYYKGENGCEVKLTFTPVTGTKAYLYKTDGFEIIPIADSYTLNVGNCIWGCADGVSDLRMHVWGTDKMDTGGWAWANMKVMTPVTAKYNYKNWFYYTIPSDETSTTGNYIFVWNEAGSQTNNIENATLTKSHYYEAWGSGHYELTW